MKNKLTAVLLVFAMLLSVVYGCGLIQLDNERDMAQVIAAVGDDDYKDEILKKDLVALYINQGSSYVQNYNLSVGETMDILLKQLINNRILIQEGTKILISEKGLSGGIKDYLNKDSIDGKKSTSMKKLLGDDAYEAALSNVYKYERETLDSYEKEVLEDWATPAPSDAPTPTPTPAPTPTPRPTKVPDVLPTETPNSPNPSPSTESRIEAYKRLVEDLMENEKTEDAKKAYDNFFEKALVSYLENEILKQYQDYLFGDINITLDDLTDRYNMMTTMQEQQFSIDLSAYTTKLEKATKDTFMLYNPLEGYGYVKNLLIGFDTKLSALISELQNKEWSKNDYLANRALLLEKIEVKDLREYVEEKDKVNYPDINTFYATEIIPVFGGTKNAKDVYTGSEFTDEKTNKFIDLIFQYGTDPGMFNNTMDYLSAPKTEAGVSEKYVIEFAEAARDVIEAGKGSYKLVGTDFGWHVIYCTDVIVKNGAEHVNESDYQNMMTALETVKYDDLAKSITNTFTYRLYNVMREEIKTSVYNSIAEKVIKVYEDNGKVVKFENRYSELKALK